MPAKRLCCDRAPDTCKTTLLHQVLDLEGVALSIIPANKALIVRSVSSSLKKIVKDHAIVLLRLSNVGAMRLPPNFLSNFKDVAISSDLLWDPSQLWLDRVFSAIKETNLRVDILTIRVDDQCFPALAEKLCLELVDFKDRIRRLHISYHGFGPSPSNANMAIQALRRNFEVVEFEIKLCSKTPNKKSQPFHADVAIITAAIGNIVRTMDLYGRGLSTSDLKLFASSVQNAVGIQKLHLGNNNVSSAGAAMIADSLMSIRGLLGMDLTRNNLGRPGALSISRGLGSAPSLETLVLEGCNLGKGGAIAVATGLVSVPLLSTLNLADNHIGCDGVAAIAKELSNTPRLKVLNLGENGIGPRGICSLGKALKDVPLLEELHLYRNMIGFRPSFDSANDFNDWRSRRPVKQKTYLIEGGELSELASGLRFLTSLSTLVLDCNGLEDLDAVHIVQGIAPSLKVLRIGNNKIGSQGIAAVSSELLRTTNLQALYVNGNCLKVVGATAVALTFPRLTTLQVLDVYSDQLGSAGVSAISKQLCHLKSLLHLNLAHNEMGPHGAIELGKALTNIAGLVDLNVSYNQLGAAGTLAICNSLDRHSSLRILSLSDNEMGDDGLRYVSSIVPKLRNLRSLNLQQESPYTKRALKSIAGGLAGLDSLENLCISRGLGPSISGITCVAAWIQQNQ